MKQRAKSLYRALPLLFLLLAPVRAAAQDEDRELDQVRDELEQGIAEAEQSRAAVGRARELLGELNRRVAAGELDDEDAARASGQVLEALSGVLGEAMRNGRAVQDRAKGQVLPKLDALADKLAKEAELDPVHRSDLLDLREEMVREAEGIRSELQRLARNLETLVGIRKEVDRMRSLHNRRLEVARLAGRFGDALRKLNEAMEALEAEWKVEP